MSDSGKLCEFVTFTTADQLFGLPIGRVQDVFKPNSITKVPLAGAEIAGVLNLRGRIVTAIELRSQLDLGARDVGDVVLGGAEHYLGPVAAGQPAQYAQEVIAIHLRHIPVE